MEVLTAIQLFSSGSFIVYGILCVFSPSMHREFERFGLTKFRTLVGILEVLGGLGLWVGVRYSPIAAMASAGLSLLMILGFSVRIKIKDSLMQALPALFFAFINLYILIKLL